MKNKILLGTSIIFGLLFINSGLNKLFNYIPQPDDLSLEVQLTMTAFMATGWLMPLIAIVEIIGGVLVMIPKTRALGAIVIFPIMVGIIAFHLVQAPETLVFALFILAINLWIIWENRGKYLPMVIR